MTRPAPRIIVALALARGARRLRRDAAERRPSSTCRRGRAERGAPEAPRALVDRVRRPGAHRADRRGARAQPRPRAPRSRASSSRARRCCSRSRTCTRTSNLVAGAAARASAAWDRRRFRPASPLVSNNFSVGLELSYELDLWGKYRRAIAGRAATSSRASRYFRETVRIAVAADVATRVLPAARGRRRAAAPAGHARDARRIRCSCRATAGTPGSSATTTCAGRGRAFGRRREHRTRTPGHRAARSGDGDADRATGARGVRAGGRARRRLALDLRGARASRRAAVRPDRTAPRHPPRRSAPRRVGASHPAGARRLLPVDLAHRCVRFRIGRACGSVHIASVRVAFRRGSASAVVRAQGHRGEVQAADRAPRRGDRHLSPSRADCVPRGARRARRAPDGA